eukprot:3860431-Pyramimonas_sp.AAC.1
MPEEVQPEETRGAVAWPSTLTMASRPTQWEAGGRTTPSEYLPGACARWLSIWRVLAFNLDDGG